ncbi:hypothetical protein MBLNU459_g7902t1 [Dothideomycetes sp. NU459]
MAHASPPSEGSLSGSSSSSSNNNNNNNKRPVDPILRNALRYTVSAKEYKLLHDYLISRAPAVERRTPQPRRFEKIVEGNNDYNVAAVGSMATGLLLILPKPGGPKAGTLRISASLSLILLFHRLLHRFLLRLRASLLDASARPFRLRNPRVSLALTSRYTPAIGAALSGLLLGVCPKSQLRMTMAIYAFTRALEFAYNAAEENGIWGTKGKPDWVGSWMIMPFACGQLLHAFVFDRECFPESYGKFILKRSPEYIQQRPTSYPPGKAWPGTFEIVDGLAEMSRLHWPPFVSPILFPAAKQPLAASLSNISAITAPAHPGITHASCALLHPSDPSCTRTYLKYFLASFPSTARFFTLIYAAFALLSYKSFLADPTKALNKLASRILKMSLFITGAIGTSWGSICLFSNYLPRNMLSTQRWFLGGFIGGMWAFLARRGERSNFLYSARLSLDSLWKVGVKRGWWSGVRSGDVLVFAASMALIDAIYESRPNAIRGAMLRKGMGVLRGEGWTDRAHESAVVPGDKADGDEETHGKDAEA